MQKRLLMMVYFYIFFFVCVKYKTLQSVVRRKRSVASWTMYMQPVRKIAITAELQT